MNAISKQAATGFSHYSAIEPHNLGGQSAILVPTVRSVAGIYDEIDRRLVRYSTPHTAKDGKGTLLSAHTHTYR